MTKTQLCTQKIIDIAKTGEYKLFIYRKGWRGNYLKFTAKEFSEKFLHNEFPLSLVSKVLKTLLNTTDGKALLQLSYSDWDTPISYEYKNWSNLVNLSFVKKEKNLLYFNIASILNPEHIDTIMFDFITHTFNKEIPLEDIAADTYCPSRHLYENILSHKNDTPEWIFTYTDDITTIDKFFDKYYGTDAELKQMLEECPKGLINYLKEFNQNFDYFNIRDYVLKKNLGNFGFNVYTAFKTSFSFKEILMFVKNKKLLKEVVHNTWDRNNISASIYTLIRVFMGYKSKITFNTLFSLLSESDDIDSFSDKCDIEANKELNKKIAKELTELNFINNINIDDEHIVIVPQDVKDLQKEGNQQHNCVGHYYNDSISRGVNKIYFIRKKNNPNASFITCRYHVKSEDTVEARGFSNRFLSDAERDIVNKVTNIINNHYEKEGM